MRIIQLVSNLNYGDAIGNDVLNIHTALQKAGFDAIIYAVTVHPAYHDFASEINAFHCNPDDLLLVHKAAGDPLFSLTISVPCRKVLIYHNITPAKYFLPYDAVMTWNLSRGRRQLKKLIPYMDAFWGDSSFNCQELIALGAPSERVSVLPILREKSNQKADDAKTLQQLKQQTGTKLLFVGRIAPNKKQEDIIKVFDTYLKYDPKASLYLIGSHEGMDKYYAKLRGFAADLHLSDDQVIFPGHISDESRNAYFSVCDVFVCMSEHEGFCVPLLEAMESEIPVIAYSAGAIPETLGKNGLLKTNKNYEEIATNIHHLQTDENFRSAVLSSQRTQLLAFEPKVVKDKLYTLINEVLER